MATNKIILINNKAYSVFRDKKGKIQQVEVPIQDYINALYMTEEFARTQNNQEQRVQISQ